MTGNEALPCWAPPDAPWTRWVRSVLFNRPDGLDVEPSSLGPPPPWLGPELLASIAPRGLPAGSEMHPYRRAHGPAYLADLADVALVVDLPGAASACAGVALARHGFQPVPLYNARPSAAMIVDQAPAMAVLLAAAAILPVPAANAPPAFLLDASRMTSRFNCPIPGSFDNRSVCSATDFPSAEELTAAGIRRAVFVQERGVRPAVDLGETLYLWRKGGIEIFAKPTSEPGLPLPCPRPRAPWPSRARFRLETRSLLRHPDGSYGKPLPPPKLQNCAGEGRGARRSAGGGGR